MKANPAQTLHDTYSPNKIKIYNYIKNFHCLADKCSNTCCQGWRIEVSDTKANHYRKSHKELLSILATDDGGYKIAGSEEGSCSLLKDGLCSLQIDYDESTLPDVCGQYPRMYRSVNEHTIGAASMSCPEIARLCLFEDNAFDCESTRLTIPPETTQTDLPELGGDPLALTRPFVDAALAPDTPAEEAMLKIIAVSEALESMPCHTWLQRLEILFDKPGLGEKAEPQAREEAACHDIVLILWEMLATHHISDAVREQVARAFSMVNSVGDEEPTLVLLPLYRQAYEGRAFDKINAVLKRYIAGEMTRIGFPVISQTAFGRDYGTSLSAWAQTLCVRFLALRLLLITHIQNDGAPPEDSTIVELVHRLSRQINHEFSGSVEKNFTERTRDNFMQTAQTLMGLN